MIAVDTSSMVAYFQGEAGSDSDRIDFGLEWAQLVLPPVVLTELLSDPKLPSEFVKLLSSLPILEIEEGYWSRAAELRQKLIKKGRRARIADALIAQSCIDHSVPLITRDQDFKALASLSSLELLRE